MLNDARSHGLWELTAPPAPETIMLRSDIAADVVIVGGGYSGISAALHLAQAGKSVVLLEAVEIGFGASGRNSGLVNAGMWVMPNDLIATLGALYGQRLITLLGNAPSAVFDVIERYAIRCEADRRGTYHCAFGNKGLLQIKARTAQWQRLGAPVEFLDAAATASKTGVTEYAGSLLDHRAGTIQPLAYVRGLARAALSEGAQLFTGSAAVSMERTGSDWLVRTAQGSVRAEWLIVATDVYSQGPVDRVRAEQVRMPYFHITTPPLGANLRRSILPDGGAAWNTKTVLSHFRLDASGRLIVGSIGALKGSGLPIHRSWARRNVRKLFPQLGDIAFETEWYGMIGMTGDHLPRLHTFGEKALGFSAYNGRGIAPGTVFGREMARHILGEVPLEEMPLPVTPVKRPNFRSVKEVYYELGAQIAHLPIAPL